MNKKRLFWVDLEMSGLDEIKERILEVAVVITDLDFNPLDEFHRIVYQPQEVLDGMDEWNTRTHGESGLTAAVPNGTPIEQVESELLVLCDKHYKSGERIVLCGNSVGNDKRFLDRYMPELAKRLHYRIIDVSSFKEIFREKYGVKFEKGNAHRAVDDIHESIRELKLYLSHVQPPAGGNS